MKAMFDPAIWNDDQVRVPVQAIMAKSPFWTPDYVKYVHVLCPHLDYREMDGVGHFLMMEKPREFNDITMGFLKREGFLKGSSHKNDK